MKTKDIFRLAVRLLGLFFLYQGLVHLPQLISLWLSSSLESCVLISIQIVWPLFVAYWFLRGAPPLVRIAYPDASGHSESEQPVAGAKEKQVDA